MKRDYLIVGAGLFGAVFAHEATAAGKKCLVLDRRPHVGGNIYTEDVEGIQVHRYGAHIFHTSNRAVWQYISRFAEFNHYVNSPVANYRGKLYNLPFNMNTFYQLWGATTPAQAQAIIEEQRRQAGIDNPQNLEEQALALAGRDIYEALVKGYTEKQWGTDCKNLPAFIIRRLPFRFTFDNNYFSDPYQGIPIGGYTPIIEKLLEGTEVLLNTDYREFIMNDPAPAVKTIYTGPIDEFFGYQYGELGYRSLRFETETMDCENHQGNAVINYTAREVPYTRVIEHKHFEFGTQPRTVVTKEYPAPWQRGDEPYYPVNNEENSRLYERYAALAAEDPTVVFGGRLGGYRYFDMDKTIEAALALAGQELG